GLGRVPALAYFALVIAFRRVGIVHIDEGVRVDPDRDRHDDDLMVVDELARKIASGIHHEADSHVIPRSVKGSCAAAAANNVNRSTSAPAADSNCCQCIISFASSPTHPG